MIHSKRVLKIFPALVLAAVAALLAPPEQAQTITTVEGGYTGDGGPATEARLVYPEYAIKDRQGNLFISDFGGNRVRKVDPSGVITTYAGMGAVGFSGDGGPAAKAQLAGVTGLALDSEGRLYIADQFNARIRRVNTAGVITTIAGTGTHGYSGDTGPAVEADLTFPWALAFDAAGNLYFSDNNVVRKINTGGYITTVAGNGRATGSLDGEGGNPDDDLGDGRDSCRATLNDPHDLSFDKAGNLYIADRGNNRVRKVDGSGTITTLVRVVAPNGLASDGAGKLYVSGNSTIHRVELRTGKISLYAGSARGFDGDHHRALQTRFGFESPAGLAWDSAGDLIVSDPGNGRVRLIEASRGLVTTVAGGYAGHGSAGSTPRLLAPSGLAVDRSGNLFISETYGHRLLEMDAEGNLHTLAGTGINGYFGDGGPATSAALNFPYDVAVSANGEVYVGDEGNFAIRKISASGRITTPMQNTSYVVDALAVDEAGNVYFTDIGRCVVRRLDAQGKVSVVAGIEDSCGFEGDGGPAGSAKLRNPLGIAVDRPGNLYIADYGNNRVRRVDIRDGTIRTVAGNGTCQKRGKRKTAKSAGLCRPSHVAVDTKGDLFIADAHRVREVRKNGRIVSLATSSAVEPLQGDCGDIPGCAFFVPTALAVDPLGNVYVADIRSGRIFKIVLAEADSH